MQISYPNTYQTTQLKHQILKTSSVREWISGNKKNNRLPDDDRLFFEAVKNGDLNIVKQYSIKAQGISVINALLQSLYNSNLAITRHLLDLPNIKAASFSSLASKICVVHHKNEALSLILKRQKSSFENFGELLMLSIHSKNFQASQQLVESMESTLAMKSISDIQPIIESIKVGDAQSAIYFVDLHLKYQFNSENNLDTDTQTFSSLHNACRAAISENHLDVLEYTLSKIQVENRVFSHNSLLYQSGVSNNKEIASYLITQGVDTDGLDRAFVAAFNNQHFELCEYFMQQGANPEGSNNEALNNAISFWITDFAYDDSIGRDWLDKILQWRPSLIEQAFQIIHDHPDANNAKKSYVLHLSFKNNTPVSSKASPTKRRI